MYPLYQDAKDIKSYETIMLFEIIVHHQHPSLFLLLYEAISQQLCEGTIRPHRFSSGVKNPTGKDSREKNKGSFYRILTPPSSKEHYYSISYTVTYIYIYI